MKYLTFVSLLLCTLTSQARAQTGGIVVVNDGSTLNAFSKVYEFSQFAVLKLTSVETYKLTLMNGELVTGLFGHVKAVIEYPSETADMTTPGEAVYVMRTKLEEMQKVSALYEKSRLYLNPWILKIDALLKRVNPDDVRYHGVWMSEREYQTLLAKAKMDEVPELTVAGRKLKNVKVRGIVGDEVSLEQPGSITKVKISDLGFTALRQLATASVVFRDNADVRKWYGQFLETFSAGGKIFQGVRFVSLSGDKLKLVAETGEVILSYDDLSNAELATLATKAPEVKQRLDGALALEEKKAQAEFQYNQALQAEKDKEWTRARSLYEKASTAGHALAGVNLGALYFSGEGGPRDESGARTLFAEAAKKGDVIAAYNAGLLRFSKLQPGSTDQECVSYLEQAAVGKIPMAEYLLGIMYADGSGVTKDLEKGHQYLVQAKSRGVLAAAAALERVEERMKPLR
jgi:hypothetical protein